MKHLYFLFLCLVPISGFSQTIGIQQFATGFTSPVEIVHAGDDRLFVVEQTGKIRILNTNGTINATPFLQLTTATISTGGERGLLGLAFHPNYATNGFFYVDYTNTSGNTVIARYSKSLANDNLADPASAMIMLTIAQPFSNHNGGTLKFGPDGYLYIGMGDGGDGGDPGNRAQNKNVLLGKMLRLDVDSASPYGIPPTNPYVGIDGADEIWAIGMRNPWKFSFDNVGGNLWIGDVGQESVEEIDKVPTSSVGLNFGWRCYEGTTPYNTTGCADSSTMTFPFATYLSTNATTNCSITGGYVYRGSTYPNFYGKYFFADYCSNKIGMVNDAAAISYSAVFSGTNFTTFGVDINNELYAGASGNGKIYKVIDTSLGVNDIARAGFAISPNPASSAFSIKSLNGNFPVQLTIYDMTAKRLISQQLDSETAVISTDRLQTGLYLVTIEDKTGTTSNTRLVIK